MKNPLTPAGIEPATFRFVAQHLNHCATAVPGLVYMLLIFRRELHPPSCRSGLQNVSKIVGARRITRRVFHTEDLQILVATVTWRLGFAYPSCRC